MENVFKNLEIQSIHSQNQWFVNWLNHREIWLNSLHAGLYVRIYTEVCICWNSRYKFQWIFQQQMMIEPRFNVLNTFPWQMNWWRVAWIMLKVSNQLRMQPFAVPAKGTDHKRSMYSIIVWTAKYYYKKYQNWYKSNVQIFSNIL